MKTVKIILVLFGLSLAVLAGFFGGTLLSKAKGAQVAPWPPDLNVDNWKTYANKDFQYSFKYPSDWYLDELPGSPVKGADGVQISNYVLDSLPSKGPVPKDLFKMSVFVRANAPLKEGQTLDDWISSEYGSPQLKQEKSLQIDGRDAREVVIEYYPGVMENEIKLVIKNIKYGNLITSILAPSFDEPEMEKVFRLIVTTFKIED